MYARRIVDVADTKDIIANPYHPNTIGMLKSVPRLDSELGRKLVPIVGMPPSLIDMPPICAFLPRCKYSIKKCKQEPWPALTRVHDEHYVACYADVQGNKDEPIIK